MCKLNKSWRPSWSHLALCHMKRNAVEQPKVIKNRILIFLCVSFKTLKMMYLVTHSKTF